MHQRTLEEEIPDVKESLEFYIKSLEKELEQKEPVVVRIKLVLKKANEKLERINKSLTNKIMS
jgi:hypothetical protein